MTLDAKVLTIAETSRILRLNRNQTYAAARNGEIPSIRIGKRVLVLADPLERMLRTSSSSNSRTATKKPGTEDAK